MNQSGIWNLESGIWTNIIGKHTLKEEEEEEEREEARSKNRLILVEQLAVEVVACTFNILFHGTLM